MDSIQYQLDEIRRRLEKIEAMERNGWRDYKMSVQAMLNEWSADRDWRGRVKTQLKIIGALSTLGVAALLNTLLRLIVP